MHISTRKTFGKSRRIERASRYTSSTSWTFDNGTAHYSAPVPALSISLDGQDGKTYTIGLYEHDIEGLIEAYKKYRKEYPDRFSARPLGWSSKTL